MKKQTKFIFITGGVISSLGKGLTAASIALLLKRRGYKVKLQKLDPYLNVDPGTMSPYQHGEVYVTVDGAETDLDLGHYERFSETLCSRESNYTTGKIYSNVIMRERKGEYLGKTVQVIPHITDEIKNCIKSIVKDDVDIVITEIGGTAGDIESLPFLEAIRQFRQDVGKNNSLFIHITLVPFIKAAGEMKTKPSQQSVGILRSIGIFPDILICRTEKHMTKEHKEKLALFCNVDKKLVFEEKDVDNSIYEVPVELMKQQLDLHCLKMLKLKVNQIQMDDWMEMLRKLIHPKNSNVKIAVVGKYISLRDSYKSIYEALTHGAIANNTALSIAMIESEDIEKKGAENFLSDCDGILIPGGFGDRGIEGKIAAAKFARENKIPFFGICLGMQCAVIEFARNKCNLQGANSSEFDKNTKYPVIHIMESQNNVKQKGGTMRLGAYPCILKKESLAAKIYTTDIIHERHRHRYELNNSYRDIMEKNGLKIVGTSPDEKLVEIVELKDHPWFVACQFHPEFQSTPLKAHPLFRDFIKTALSCKNKLKE
ncbi:MAG TPA: CTP synthase [Victivallales bacterium]|mgnify:CR=1 FL=1|nr:CTP synthase [Victivallales bacterium]HRU00629.1 CTP synthase [Victivallales bacterium]